MANTLLLKKSGTASETPTSGELLHGELAINYADGKLFFKNSGNSVVEFLSSPGTSAGQVLFSNGSTMDGDNDLFWDNTTKRLGIGDTTPANELTVDGTVSATACEIAGELSVASIDVNNIGTTGAGNIATTTLNVDDHLVSDSIECSDFQIPHSGIVLDNNIGVGGNYILEEQGRQNHVANTMSSPYYRFNGVDDTIDVADSYNLSFGDGTSDSPFSISAWINMEDATSFDIINKGSYNVDAEWRFESGGSEQLGLWLYDNDVASTYEGAYTTADIESLENQWIHVCATYNGVGGTSANEGITLYVNGVSQAVSLADNGTYVAMENLTNEVRIGNYNDISYSQGSISNLKIHNLELSATEVKELYSGASVPYKYKGASQWYFTSGTLTIGKKYRINDWITNDDFTNIGGTNEDGNEFVATGTTPTTWTNSSTVVRIGAVAEYDGSSASGTTWYDKSGNNLDGTVSDASLENIGTLVLDITEINTDDEFILNGTGGINIDSSGGEIKIGEDAVAQRILIGGETSIRTELELNAGLMDFNAGVAGFKVNSVGVMQLDSDSSSRFRMAVNDAGNKTLVIDAYNIGAGVGNIDIDADGLIDITAVGNMTIDSDALSIDSKGTTNLTMTSNDAGNKTLSIESSNAGVGVGHLDLEADGDISLTAVGALDMESGNTDWDTGPLSIDSTGTTNISMTSNDAGNKTFSIVSTNDGVGVGNLDMDADGSISITAVGALDIEGGNTDLDSTTLSIDSTDTTNISMRANSGSSREFSMEALNSGAGYGTFDLESDIITFDVPSIATSDENQDGLYGSINFPYISIYANSTDSWITAPDNYLKIYSKLDLSLMADGNEIKFMNSSSSLFYEFNMDSSPLLTVTGPGGNGNSFRITNVGSSADIYLKPEGGNVILESSGGSDTFNFNTDTSLLTIRNDHDDSKDPKIIFTDSDSGDDWSIGMDTTDTDADPKFKIHSTTTLATTGDFELDTDGNGLFRGNIASTGLTLEVGSGGGVIIAGERTNAPTTVANYGQIYNKSDNEMYFKDGAGNERQISNQYQIGYTNQFFCHNSTIDWGDLWQTEAYIPWADAVASGLSTGIHGFVAPYNMLLDRITCRIGDLPQSNTDAIITAKVYRIHPTYNTTSLVGTGYLEFFVDETPAVCHQSQMSMVMQSSSEDGRPDCHILAGQIVLISFQSDQNVTGANDFYISSNWKLDLESYWGEWV